MTHELKHGLELEEVFGEDSVDVSYSVEVYENGKTMECPDCGAGTGIKKDVVSWKCYDCGIILVDVKYDERENEEVVEESGGQMKLGEFA